MAEATEAARAWQAADLIGGEDEDFVTNLYLAVLGRLPDPAGRRHYLASIDGRPERRLEALREMAASEEARRAGTRIVFGAAAVPPGPTRALAVTLAIRTEWLQREVARLQEALGVVGGAGIATDVLEARDVALHYEIAELRREVTGRLDAALGPPGGEAAAARDSAAAGLARLVADRMAEQAAALEAKFEQRLRAHEARLLALEARLGA